MADAPTTAAPTTPATPGQQPPESAKPGVPAEQAKPGRERGPDGKFLGAKAGEPAKEAEAPTPKKWKLKRGQSEEEVDEARLLHLAQKGYGADKYFEEGRKEREAAASERALTDRIKNAKTTAEARAALKELLGDRAREVAEEEIYEAIQAERLTPEQRRIRELEAEKQGWEKTQKEAKEKAENEKTEAEAQGLREQIGKTAKAALEKAGLPAESAWVGIRRMAPRLMQALEMGEQPDHEALAAEVREELMGEHRALAKGLKGEALVSWLGDEVANEIRRWDLARLRQGALQPKAAAPAAKTNGEKFEGDPRKGRWNFIDKLERGEIP